MAGTYMQIQWKWKAFKKDLSFMREKQKRKYSQEELLWFENFMTYNWGKIANIIYYKVGDRGLSEDLSQEVCILVLKHICTLYVLDGYRFRYYLNRIIQTVVADYFRKKEKTIDAKSDTEIDFDQIETDYQSYINPEKCMINKVYLDVIRRLPKKYSSVVICHLFWNMPFKDIAKIDHITEDAARKRYERARKILKDKFKHLK